MSRWAMLVDIEPVVDPTATNLRISPGAKRGTAGQAYRANANATGGTEPYTYSAVTSLPAWATLDADTGEITGTPTGEEYTEVELEVEDALGATRSIVVAINIVDAIAITGTLAPCEVGIPYSSGFTVVGAVGAVTWGLSGSLGLNPIFIDTSTGILSGTAFTQGVFPAVVQVTDSTGATASLSFDFDISAGLAYSPVVTAPAGLVGSYYEFRPPITNGVAPFLFETDVDIPSTFPGLAFDPNTGTVYGIPSEPTATVDMGFLINCTDLLGAFISQPFFLTINQAVANPVQYWQSSFFGNSSATTFNLIDNPYPHEQCTGQVYEVVSGNLVLVEVDVKFNSDQTIDVGPFVKAPTGSQQFLVTVVAGLRP